MPQYAQEKIQEHYQKLPQTLQEAVFSMDVSDKVYLVGKKFGLTIEKIGFLAEETGYVILGLTRPQEFIGILADRLEIGEDRRVRDIAAEINHQIFYPLRESLKEAHQMEITGEEIQKAEQKDFPQPEIPKSATEKPPPLKPLAPTPPSTKIPPIDLRTKPLSASTPPTTPIPAISTKPADTAKMLPKETWPAEAPQPEKVNTAKSEIMRSGIFGPPVAAKDPQKNPAPPATPPKIPEKKSPYGEEDPYRETAE